jgi:hypothetical protein
MYPFRIIDLCLLVNLQIQNINKRNQDIKAPTFSANKNNAVIAIILNRNLGKECDALREVLLSKGVSDVIIVDSSTDPS